MTRPASPPLPPHPLTASWQAFHVCMRETTTTSMKRPRMLCSRAHLSSQRALPACSHLCVGGEGRVHMMGKEGQVEEAQCMEGKAYK